VLDDGVGLGVFVIGGTGSWSEARGQVLLHARNPQGTEYDFTFVEER